MFHTWANPSFHPHCFSLEPQSHPSAIILSWLSSFVYTELLNQQSLEAVKVFLVGFLTRDLPGEQVCRGLCQAMSTVGGRTTSDSRTRYFRSTVLLLPRLGEGWGELQDRFSVLKLGWVPGKLGQWVTLQKGHPKRTIILRRCGEKWIHCLGSSTCQKTLWSGERWESVCRLKNEEE